MRKLDVGLYIGKKYGKLTIVSDSGMINGVTAVSIICDCGVIKESVLLNNIKKGNSKSCGCDAKRKTIHGLCDSPLYKIWIAMKAATGKISGVRKFYKHGFKTAEDAARYRDNYYRNLGVVTVFNFPEVM